jgi:hypothetical protein
VTAKLVVLAYQILRWFWFGEELRVDPHAELVAVDRVGQRNAGVTVAFEIAEELPETLATFPAMKLSCRALTVFSQYWAPGS